MSAKPRSCSAHVLAGMCGILAFLLYPPPAISGGPKTWKAAITGDWAEAGNWVEGSIPANGDDVFVTNSGAGVFLSGSALNLHSITVNGTLTFTNWTTQLAATDVRIMAGGVLTCSGPFVDGAMSNRVNILCTNLFLDAGASINVDSCGWAGGLVGPNIGSGPGKGNKTPFNRATSGSYGGYAGNTQYRTDVSPMPSYGSASEPVEPGSGGGAADSAGGDGGGAVRIDAGETVTVNGTISANGGDKSAENAGPGSGGGIYISCAVLAGTGGVIRARGGHAQPSWDGGGGGGRIAVLYAPSAQAGQPVPSVSFQVLGGTGNHCGDLGTLYFPDSQLLTPTISSNFSGRFLGFASWSTNAVTVSNTWIRFASDGFRLTVSGDLNIDGANARVDIGGDTVLSNIVVNSDDARGWYLFHNSGSARPVLNIGGNLLLANQATLYVYSASTNAAVSDYGVLVNVAGDVVCANSWICPVSNPTNGGAPYFTMAGLRIMTNSGINANYGGFKSGEGPGKGTEIDARGGGGGYGGVGGPGPGGPGSAGGTYGSSNAPVDAGSGGGIYSPDSSKPAGRGGGVAWIKADGNVTLDGSITANGENNYDADGGGSGGSIYLMCRKLLGAGAIEANGGLGHLTYSGGGGGGRIALYRYAGSSTFSGPITADGGTGWSNGAPGTIVFFDVIAPGTILVVQ